MKAEVYKLPKNNKLCKSWFGDSDMKRRRKYYRSMSQD